MDFRRLLEIVGDEPVFESGLLLAGKVDADDVRRQLSRWTARGYLWQLRRGLYVLAPPFQKVKPEPFIVANRLARASYVSCQSALAHYQLIPEYVPVTTSVTTGRAGRRQTPLGSYEFRHLKPALFFGYRLRDIGLRTAAGRTQRAFVATPEKALLDLIHLQPQGDSKSFLDELRLQNLDQLDPAALQRAADRTGSPKLRRAAAIVAACVEGAATEYERL